MTDWYTALQAGIDFYFNNLLALTMLEYVAILLLMLKKLTPGGARKKGWF
jgi:hypothetical protein